MRLTIPIFLLAVFAPSLAVAQRGGSAADTLTLPALQQDAIQTDARAAQAGLLSQQSALRQNDISASLLPTIGANASGQYQSQVITIPFTLPDGKPVPSPSRDSYDAYLSVQQPLYDPTLGARRSMERAQLAAGQAAVRTSLFTLRRSVNEAYFAALLAQNQAAEQQTVITDLEAQERVAAQRVKEGSALQSDADMLAAEVLRHRQSLQQLTANRDASLAVLSDLTGHELRSASALALPDLNAAIERARASIDTLRLRPEFEQFAGQRELLERQSQILSAADLPHLVAFGRAGYGRPALNPLADSFSGYWLAGLRVEWSPWNWGTTRRKRDELAIQQQITVSDERSFQQSLRRNVTRDLANADELQRTLASDDTIIALRERILRETRFRFEEGVITSADYVNRETDVLDARLQRASHLVQVAQARAGILTTLGMDLH